VWNISCQGLTAKGRGVIDSLEGTSKEATEILEQLATNEETRSIKLLLNTDITPLTRNTGIVPGHNICSESNARPIWPKSWSVLVGVFPRWALKEILRCPEWFRIRGYKIVPI